MADIESGENLGSVRAKLNQMRAELDDGSIVTDTASVRAAGAVMDDEVENLSQVKSFDSSDYATAAQGNLADSAQQPPSEGAFTDGDKTKLDAVPSPSADAFLRGSSDGTTFENLTAAQVRTALNVDRNVQSKSANFTVATSERADVYRVTAAATASLPAAATAGNGFWVTLIADGADVTIDPDGSEQINGSATLTVSDGTSVDVFCDGTGWRTTMPNGSISADYFGVTGDGSTDDTSALQDAVDWIADNLSGGVLLLGPKTYRADKLDLKDKVGLKGVYGVTTIKVPDGVDAPCVFSSDRGNSGETVDFVSLEGIIFDGNKASAAGVTASSAVGFAGARYLSVKDCVFQNATGYGFGLQAYPGTSYTGVQKFISFENCRFLNNGDGVGGATYDGVDIKDATHVTFTHCEASDNANDGFDVRGEVVNFVACHAENNGGGGFELKGNSNGEAVPGQFDLTGCTSRNNTGTGFRVADGSASASEVIYVNINGGRATGNGASGLLWTEATGNRLHLTCNGFHSASNGGDGIYVNETNIRGGCFTNCIISSNSGAGLKTEGKRLRLIGVLFRANGTYGVDESASGGRTNVVGCEFSGNTTAAVNDNGLLSAVNCFGFSQSGAVTTANIAVDSTGNRPFSVAHGLDIKPAKLDVSLTITDASANDFRVDNLRVTSTDATNVNGVLVVGAASATGGATCKVSASIKAREPQ